MALYFLGPPPVSDWHLEDSRRFHKNAIHWEKQIQRSPMIYRSSMSLIKLLKVAKRTGICIQLSNLWFRPLLMQFTRYGSFKTVTVLKLRVRLDPVKREMFFLSRLYSTFNIKKIVLLNLVGHKFIRILSVLAHRTRYCIYQDGKCPC